MKKSTNGTMYYDIEDENILFAIERIAEADTTNIEDLDMEFIDMDTSILRYKLKILEANDDISLTDTKVILKCNPVNLVYNDDDQLREHGAYLKVDLCDF